jgi:hypothetical protein
MKILIWVVLSAISGALGRLGGWEYGNRLLRLLGVPACCILMAGIFVQWNWSLILTFGCILGVTSTYFFKEKGEDPPWWDWAVYGAMEGVAFLFYAYFTHCWIGYTVRIAINALLVMIWSAWLNKMVCKILNKVFPKLTSDWVDEIGRYFIIAATVPLLGIGR